MPSVNQKSILLVEDEVIIAMMEKKLLEKKGYLVHHVGTGAKAVQAILNSHLLVDLILMDIDLGEGIDGTEAAEEILKQKDIPVVFLSSHHEPTVVEKTEKITSYGYVVKNSGIIVIDASIKMAFKLFEANLRTKLIKIELESKIENLRIHQVELKKNHVELEELRTKYTDFYDRTPAGYFTLNETGSILEANLTGADLLGVGRCELLTLSFTAFLVPEDQDLFYLHRKALLKTGTLQTCILRLKKSDGSVFIAYLKAVSAPRDSESQACLVMLITQDELGRNE